MTISCDDDLLSLEEDCDVLKLAMNYLCLLAYELEP